MHLNWNPPAAWRRVLTIDAHTGGEPFRTIVDGFPEIRGETMLARRRYAQEHCEALRRALMWEPRGHVDMYGGILTPPVSLRSHLGILFLHNEGFSTMCGHGIIALATVALETGLVEESWPEPELRIDTPAGLIIARARLDGAPAAGAPERRRRVAGVSFRNVPSFVLDLDQTVEVPGLGEVRYDLAFGGAFYAYVEAAAAGLDLTRSKYRAILECGRAIKRAIVAERDIAHPFEADLGFLYGVIFTAPAPAAEVHSRQVCVFADGEVDRSPTGTGVSGRLAILHARGAIEVDQRLVIESILGSRFGGRVISRTAFGPHPAVIPEIDGRAHITGRHEFLLDPTDELGEGFFLR